MKLCFYCGMQNFGGRKLHLRSIDNQKVIVIHSSDLYAAVSYTKYSKFENTSENIEKHEHIIQSIKKHTPVVPFPLNTIVGETIGKGVLYAHYAQLKNILRKIGRKEEFAVRVHRDTDEKLEKFYELTRHTSSAGSIPENKSKKPYNKMLDIAGHKLAARIHNQFDQISDDSRYERLISDSRFVEGYYLVSSSKVDTFKQTFNWVQSLYPELHFFLTGPKPPYHFNPVNIIAGNTQLYGQRHER